MLIIVVLFCNNNCVLIQTFTIRMKHELIYICMINLNNHTWERRDRGLPLWVPPHQPGTGPTVEPKLKEIKTNCINKSNLPSGQTWPTLCTLPTRSQSYNFRIFSYNTSVVVGYIVFQSRRKCFCSFKALGNPWRCNLKS
jgi:hypothetical protein